MCGGRTGQTEGGTAEAFETLKSDRQPSGWKTGTGIITDGGSSVRLSGIGCQTIDSSDGSVSLVTLGQ